MSAATLELLTEEKNNKYMAIKKNDFREYGIDILDKHFPKGKSKERGEAMVMLGDLLEHHNEIINALYVRKTDTPKNEGDNGRRPEVPPMLSLGGVTRARVQTEPGNRAVGRVGARVVPRRQQG